MGGKCQKPANVSQTLVQGYPNCCKWFLQDWHFKHWLLHDVISRPPFTLTIGKLRKRAQQNIPEDNVLVTCDPPRRLTRAHAAEVDSMCVVVCKGKRQSD